MSSVIITFMTYYQRILNILKLLKNYNKFISFDFGFLFYFYRVGACLGLKRYHSESGMAV